MRRRVIDVPKHLGTLVGLSGTDGAYVIGIPDVQMFTVAHYVAER